MSNFVVHYCPMKACQQWRLGDKCSLDGFDINKNMQYVANMHDSSICEIRRQIDQYRLKNLLEDSHEQDK
jgi:hypothetical protein